MPRSAPPVQKISQRLHVTQDLAARQQLILADKQAHYLRNVLRLEAARKFCSSMAAMVNGLAA